MTVIAESDACIFCEGEPTEREHMIASWLSPYLHTQDEGIPTLHSPAFRSPSDWNPVTRSVPFLDTEAKVVCHDCNGGWMKDLEDAMRRIMPPMLSGERRGLSRKARKRLA